MTIFRQISQPYFTVFDLEFTAWECSMASGWLRPGEFREIVQIGAVKLDAESLGIVGEFDLFIRPRINSLVSPYFENLTGITNRALAAHGVDFACAHEAFIDFVDAGPVAAFGHDERVIEENIRLYGIAEAKPLPAFHDLRSWFADRDVDPRGMHSCDVGPSLGASFKGHPHNALDDARSVAAAMRIVNAREMAACAA